MLVGFLSSLSPDEAIARPHTFTNRRVFPVALCVWIDVLWKIKWQPLGRNGFTKFPSTSLCDVKEHVCVGNKCRCRYGGDASDLCCLIYAIVPQVFLSFHPLSLFIMLSSLSRQITCFVLYIYFYIFSTYFSIKSLTFTPSPPLFCLILLHSSCFQTVTRPFPLPCLISDPDFPKPNISHPLLSVSVSLSFFTP